MMIRQIKKCRTPFQRRSTILLIFFILSLMIAGFYYWFLPYLSENRGDNDLKLDQKIRAEQLTSIFENGTTELQYGYCENIGDNRGYTSGRAGFTTRDGDAYEVVKQYTKKVPVNPLAKYLPELKRLTNQKSSDISGLPEYAETWKSLGNDASFRAAQDHVVDKIYYLPAMKHAKQIGITYALSKAIFYDTIIQHGEGNDPDGFLALIKRTAKCMGGKYPNTGADEKQWLVKFLEVRRDDLAHAYDPSTRKEWAKSVGRVDTFQQLIHTNNWQLKGPFTVHWEGNTYIIS